jgi:hypothetical protein
MISAIPPIDQRNRRNNGAWLRKTLTRYPGKLGIGLQIGLHERLSVGARVTRQVNGDQGLDQLQPRAMRLDPRRLAVRPQRNQ